jgi:hypothetical protein
MSKKKKFVSGLGALVLAAGVSAVASVPSNAGELKSSAARVAQAVPDINGNQRIILGTIYQGQINSGTVNYFRSVPAGGVYWTSLNNGIVSETKLDGPTQVKLNKVGQTGPKGDAGIEGPAGATGAAGDTGAAGAIGAAGLQGDAGPKGDIGITGPAGAAGLNGAQGPAGPAGPVGPAGPPSQLFTVTANSALLNRPDSGLHGDWALDRLTRTMSITRQHATEASKCGGSASVCWFYTGSLSDNGTFNTIKDANSPQAGTPITGQVKGNVLGAAKIEFYASSDLPDPSLVDATVHNADHPTATWAKMFFKPGTVVTNSTMTDWGWMYDQTNTCESWFNGLAGNTGDITGVNKC